MYSNLKYRYQITIKMESNAKYQIILGTVYKQF